MSYSTTLVSLLGLSLALLSTAAHAGKYNRVLDIGDPAPTWKELPGVDGELHSFADYKDKEVLVVVFTCNSCPYAQDYEGRFNAFAKKHAGPDSRVGFVAINVNKVEDDLLPAMQARAKEQDLVYTYLFDETQQIAKQFGAGYTPQCFVLNAKREIVYMGAFDDSPSISKVEKKHVPDAVAAVLAGSEPEVAETVPIGCRIRFERSRRKP